MTQVSLPAGEYFAQILKNLQNQVDALSTQGLGLPTVSAQYSGTLSTSSSTPVLLANSPIVTPQLGASGDALVFMSAKVGIGASGNYAQAAVYSGSTFVGAIQMAATGNGAMVGSCAASIQLSAVDATDPGGSPEFQIYYDVIGTGSATWTGMFLAVQPL